MHLRLQVPCAENTQVSSILTSSTTLACPNVPSLQFENPHVVMITMHATLKGLPEFNNVQDCKHICMYLQLVPVTLTRSSSTILYLSLHCAINGCLPLALIGNHFGEQLKVRPQIQKVVEYEVLVLTAPPERSVWADADLLSYCSCFNHCILSCAGILRLPVQMPQPQGRSWIGVFDYRVETEKQ